MRNHSCGHAEPANPANGSSRILLAKLDQIDARRIARMSLTRSMVLATCLLAGVFAALGALFVTKPALAAGFYGLPADDPTALLYVRAVGLRDLALAAYLLGLTLAGQRRALSIVFIGTLVIPIGDILLLASSDAGRTVHYLLHGASLLCFAGLALWTRQPMRVP